MVVLDESALIRPIGGRAVMGQQLDHLLEISQLPKCQDLCSPDVDRVPPGAYGGIPGDHGA
ncbi:Scr1 family TA system antitoxin-like transcriptional regulator [Thermobifida fusca]|uniref:Scr1 family TA system antitoxin-like transcriptional regulator n=1 Tax=Thermobifida fusca TaxID=2021 RepID=UPI0020D23ED8|nr:Scr1 family TA system antitoxin-like transcriptional regulator [Thermobifida fusca]